jgi:GNAT superfamily N-acetyltransferase
MAIAYPEHAGPETSQAPAIQIEDFRGDLAEVAGLIQKSWEENGKQGLFYTPEFLDSCLNYPGSSYSLAPTLYQGEKPCAFVAGFPRTFRYKGYELRAILCTLLSVSSEYKKRGYGVILWSELVKRARAAGYDAMVNYCVEGEPMNGMILGCCRMLKLPTERIFSVDYLMRPMQPKSPLHLVDDSRDHLAEKFHQAASLIGNDIPLKRGWTKPETQWQLHRHDGLGVSHSVRGREGLLTAYLMPAANPQRTKCLLIEDVLWGTLQGEERLALVQRLLDRGTQAGARMAFLPCLGYADLAPFRAARFRTSPRTLHCYLTIFNGDPAPEPVPSMYLDVI